MRRLLLGYLPDETPRERERERFCILDFPNVISGSHVMLWRLLLGYVPDELLSVLPM